MIFQSLDLRSRLFCWSLVDCNEKGMPVNNMGKNFCQLASEAKGNAYTNSLLLRQEQQNNCWHEIDYNSLCPNIFFG